MHARYCSTKLNLKTVNTQHGIREISVDPESSISCLRKYEGNNCLFIYKNILLVESMSFNFYSMSDGDIICSVPERYYPVLTRVTFPNDGLIKDLEREKLKMLDRKFNRIDGNPAVYKKFQKLKLAPKETNMDSDEDDDIIDDLSAIKCSKPRSDPLPAFWK